jgi:aldehyde dehydrogenase (NAD+)
MLIDGELVAAVGGREFDNFDPATEELIGTAPDAGVEDVEKAVAAARRAFDTSAWATDIALRRDCLLQLQARLRKEAGRIRSAHTAETGMPISVTSGMGVDGPIANLSYYPELITGFEWERHLPAKNIMGGGARRVVRKEPSGVVSAITPWNFPFQLNLTKIGAALAAGNTVVLKPAPDTPWSGTMLAAVAAETDLPPGVLNIVTTSDNSVAEVLTTHHEIDHVTFTGSTATGRLVMRNASDTIKRVSLELGGKSAMIVLDEEMLETAVGAATMGVCVHAGQGCVLLTRLLVPRPLMGRAAELAGAMIAQIPYGDPTDPSVLMGPVINRSQYDTVLRYMERGMSDGRLVAGGGPATQFERGYFVQPTVFADVPNSSPLAQEEIFGPVLVIIGFEDDDDAVRIANDSRYGLSGGVLAGDADRAMNVAGRLRTGTVAVNNAQWYDPESPFGGYRQSGLGREWGPEGLEDFLETKTVSYPVS